MFMSADEDFSFKIYKQLVLCDTKQKLKNLKIVYGIIIQI